MICPRCGAPNHDGSVLCQGCSTPLQTASPDLTSLPTGPVDGLHDVPVVFAPGQSLGERYTVVERIGAGGMGMVYKAIDRRLGKTVALKLIQAKAAARPGAQERFRRELSLAQQVTHTNVCRVHDLGEVEGTTFISMEYVEGQTLEVLIHSMGHLSPSQTVALGRQICAGLQAIHERGIVHRDLKPGNVMVDRLGHVLLMDFGMAYRKDQERLTAEGAIFGTLAYLSPEQGRGLADFRSDVYALGLILYEMLTGRRPPGDDGPLPLALRPPDDVCPPPSRFSPEVPGALDAIVMRCLERAADKRYASPADLGDALSALGGSVTQTATLHLGSLPGQTPPRRLWRTAGLLALACALAAGATWLAASRWRRPTIVAPVDTRVALAFLPLTYQGSDDNAYLKDLLPLALARDLAQVDGLDVTPFATSRAFSSRDEPKTVAAQLAVGFVVRGHVSVQQQRGHCRLDLSSADGRTLWTRDFSGPLAEVVRRTEGLGVELAEALGRRPAPAPARAPEALQAYLSGLSALEGWDVRANASAAQAAFTRAIALEADFAEAYAGRAMALLNEYNATRDEALIARAESDAQRALELGPSLPEAHVAAGLVHIWRGRSVKAAEAFEQAEKLAPADDAIVRRIGVAYSRRGRNQDAERMFERAIKLRPGFWDNYNAAGSHYLQTGRPAKAKAMYKKVIELHPESDVGYGNLGAALILTGSFQEVEPILLSALRLKPTAALHVNLGMAYYGVGRYGDAIAEYDKALAMDQTRPDTFINLGDAQRRLGRADHARRAYGAAIDRLRAQLRIATDDPELAAKLAVALSGAGQCSEAARVLSHLAAPVRSDLTSYVALSHAICRNDRAAVTYSLEALAQGLASDIAFNPDFTRVREDARVQRALRERPQPER
jgi:serine/threonine-protein kinase